MIISKKPEDNNINVDMPLNGAPGAQNNLIKDKTHL